MKRILSGGIRLIQKYIPHVQLRNYIFKMAYFDKAIFKDFFRFDLFINEAKSENYVQIFLRSVKIVSATTNHP